MKKIFVTIISLCLTIMLQAEVSKTVVDCTAENLSSRLTPTEKSTVTNLTITGVIDACDFRPCAIICPHWQYLTLAL